MIFTYHPIGTTQTMAPPPFTHHLNYASWQTNGYCHTAYLHLGATQLDYPHLVQYLGQNITILNDHHEPFWYGYISRLSLPHNNWEIVLDLANTYNAVKIHYTNTEDESNPAVQTNYLVSQESIDRFGRKVSYVRLSVTDRCDLRCVYCMPEKMTFVPRTQLLTLEEMETVGRAFIRLGVYKIRITGGEPMVRQNILQLFQNLG